MLILPAPCAPWNLRARRDAFGLEHEVAYLTGVSTNQHGLHDRRIYEMVVTAPSRASIAPLFPSRSATNV